MTFALRWEAVEWANNTVYGLARVVWSESINVHYRLPRRGKRRRSLGELYQSFDAACGFGGYREMDMDEKGRTRGPNRISGTKVVHESSPRWRRREGHTI